LDTHTGGVADGTDVGVIARVVDGVTKGVRNKLASLLRAVDDKVGKTISFYKEYAQLDDSDRTLERYMQQLREADLIKFRGDALKTGGSFHEYKIKFHAAIVSLYPNDTYSQAIDKLQRAFVQAAEEKDGLRVFWNKSTEQKFSTKFGYIYDNAKKEFKLQDEDEAK